MIYQGFISLICSKVINFHFRSPERGGKYIILTKFENNQQQLQDQPPPANDELYPELRDNPSTDSDIPCIGTEQVTPHDEPETVTWKHDRPVKARKTCKVYDASTCTYTIA